MGSLSGFVSSLIYIPQYTTVFASFYQTKVIHRLLIISIGTSILTLLGFIPYAADACILKGRRSMNSDIKSIDEMKKRKKQKQTMTIS
jgi:hypothetical protein